MHIGVVGTVGGWSSEKLADAAARKTGRRLLIDMKKVCLDLANHKAWFGDADLTELDALIIKKVGSRYSPDLLDRLEILRLMNEKGLKMFSAPLKILRVLDRLSCTVTLRAADIPMPETTITEDVDAAERAVRRYKSSVFKPLYTSKARGMTLIDAGPDARKQVEAFKAENAIMYIQKQIDHQGKDLGVVFLGGRYLTTYARCSNGSWNTTTHSGGKYQAYAPSEETIAVAEKAQALFGLDFTCVDVAETDDGPLVFEVSAFGGFKGIQTASHMDASDLFVDYVINRLTG